MKYPLAVIFSILSTVKSTSVKPIAASSNAGSKLVKEARHAEENGANNDNNYYKYDMSWMQDYSLKFIGCHNVAQWNDGSNDNDGSGVRIKTHRYVRFRLCPSESCSEKKSLGCSSSYGDYVVDMGTYIQAHIEHEKEILEEKCQEYANNCKCENDGNNNVGECLDECYYEGGMTECQKEGQENNLHFLERYSSCNEFNYNNANQRNLAENAVKYYIGPYCADGGKKVVLGVFTDNTCTTFADSDGGKMIYETMTGSSLAYTSDSLIDNSCYSCNKTLDNYYHENEIRGICADTYQVSGKCETRLHKHLDSVNENACTWIQGIKVTPIHANGIIHAKYYGSLQAAIAITFFAIAFVALFFYILFLRSKLAENVKSAENGTKTRGNSPVVKKSRWFRFVAFLRMRSWRRKKSNKKNEALL
mmetsp:Transcript_6324/g.11944  ORF Transcript_6324/g.11944 Transcript_6324/m.11944 type:complete len:419 (+) Transcript_6324:40-1296(+)